MKTKNHLVAFSIVLAFFISNSTVSFAQSGKGPTKPVIIGYISGGGWTKDQIEAQKLTHVNYAFAVPAANGELAPLSAKDGQNLLTLSTLKADNKDLKILISIGGWGGCKYFSDAALTDASRRKFANSAINLLKKYKLDGIDIDWEYPAQIGDNNIFRPEDKQNYTLLFKELREQLDKQGKLDKRTGANHYLLTTATGVDTAFVSHTELGKAQRYLDYVNIMTYDIYHGNDKVTGHHSNLYQSKKGNQSRNSSADGVDGHIKAGVPASKIVLGIPFYGRGWADVTPNDNGLYQPAVGKHSFISYDELADKFISKNGFVRYWDNDAKAPYLWNPESRTFISYADEESFEYKVNYVKSKGLAGVMFWEYIYDLRQQKLLNKLVKELRN